MNKLHDDLIKLTNKINLRWYMVLHIYWILLKCLDWFDIWTCLNGQVNSSTLDSIWVSHPWCVFGAWFFQYCGVEVLLTRGRLTLEQGEIFTRWVNSMPHPVPIKLSSMPLWAICTAAITNVRLWHVLLMWTSQSAQTTILELARKVRSKKLRALNSSWKVRQMNGFNIG